METPNGIRAVRLPAELVARAEALVPALRHDPRCIALGRMSGAAAVRVLLIRGIEAAEAGVKRKPPAAQ